MKKIVVMVFLLGLAVVSVQAKTSDRTGDVIKKNVSRAIGDVYWQLHTQAVEKQGIDAKNQEWVNHIAKDVSDQLNRLNERKEYKGTLSAVIAAHNYLIQSAGQSGKEELVVQRVYFAAEALNSAVNEVTARDKSLGRAVKAFVGHLYWVEIKEEGLSLQEISEWAHAVHPNLPYTTDELK